MDTANRGKPTHLKMLDGHRSIGLHRIEADKIEASYKNGVLEVHLPKGEEAKSKRIAVQAK